MWLKNGENILVLVAMAVLFWHIFPVSLTMLVIKFYLKSKCNYTNSQYFLASYVEKREQRTKVNDSDSYFGDRFSGVPQCFILIAWNPT